MKTIDSTYAKEDLKKVAANATNLNAEERTQLLRCIQYFEDFFDGTLVDWDKEPANLELNPYPKPFNCKYYLFPRINREFFCQELQR